MPDPGRYGPQQGPLQGLRYRIGPDQMSLRALPLHREQDADHADEECRHIQRHMVLLVEVAWTSPRHQHLQSQTHHHRSGGASGPARRGDQRGNAREQETDRLPPAQGGLRDQVQAHCREREPPHPPAAPHRRPPTRRRGFQGHLRTVEPHHPPHRPGTRGCISQLRPVVRAGSRRSSAAAGGAGRRRAAGRPRAPRRCRRSRPSPTRAAGPTPPRRASGARGSLRRNALWAQGCSWDGSAHGRGSAEAVRSR